MFPVDAANQLQTELSRCTGILLWHQEWILINRKIISGRVDDRLRNGFSETGKISRMYFRRLGKPYSERILGERKNDIRNGFPDNGKNDGKHYIRKIRGHLQQ